MSHANPYLLAAQAFGVVFVGMGILALFLFILRVAARRPPAPAPEVPRPADDFEELAVVLAAAARVALGGPVRVHRVHIHRDDQAGMVWSRAGRIDVLTSHRVVPKR